MEIQGFGYASYWNGQFAKTASDQSLNNLVKTGATWISVTSTWYTDNLNSAGIHATPDTELNANVGVAIDDAQTRGLKVILKPHLDPDSGEWRGLYAPSDPTAWFAAYKTWIVGQAKLAQFRGAEALMLGTELDSVAGSTYRAEWEGIIAAVRAVYKGQISYSSIAEKANTVCFWDLLDFASVTAYPSAGSDGSVSPGQIEESWIGGDSYWTSYVDMLSSLHAATGKSVMISETGYRSVDGAIREPGTWTGKGYVDVAEQLEGYRGLLAALHLLDAQDWFRGALLWKWDPVPKPSVSYAANPGVNNDYSVQERPQALAEISNFFKGSAGPQKNLVAGSAAAEVLNGTAGADVMAGRAGDDTLLGGAGNDRFNGGLGNDLIDGGEGNDTVSFLGEYVAVKATLGEGSLPGSASGLGKDTLIAIENLFGSDKADVLTGNSAANRLWGSAGADQLIGLGGNDTLEGGPGADTLDGGLGADTADYGGALSAVQVHLGLGTAAGSASGGGGNDVLLAIEHLVGSNYDDLLVGNGVANNLNGGVGNDSLSGGGGNDLLLGGLGKDVLQGGAGADVFRFNTALDALSNLDRIEDFSSGVDKLQLENAIFRKLTATGPLSPEMFAALPGGKAQRASDYVVYDTVTGTLAYDADGNGPLAAVAFVVLSGAPSVLASDLVVI